LPSLRNGRILVRRFNAGLGMMFFHVPPPMITFAATMGVNYDQQKKRGGAGKENDNHGIMRPYPSQKSQCVLIHCQQRKH
jgi:hypothetical protein